MGKVTQRMVRFGAGIRDPVPSTEFGNKAAGLSTMAQLGVPVPPGFSLPVSVCEDYYRNGEILPEDLPSLLEGGISFLEKATGSVFGGTRHPLLVSVRSGAPVSMPGVMESILNVGLNRETVRGLTFISGNPRFAWDTYRRFFLEYARVAFSQDPLPYRLALQAMLGEEGASDPGELNSRNLRDLASQYERIFSSASGIRFPFEVEDQLAHAVTGVIRSWTSPRAEAYRGMNLLREVRGTAVTVQAMVFGNLGSRSGAGVAFSRNPWLGTDDILVDFKFGAQGEDVVSGEHSATAQSDFIQAMPGVWHALKEIAKRLELYFRDMQDIEFTVEEGKLYVLQARSGKRSPFAALKIAVALCREGIISPPDVMWMLRDVDIDSIRLQTVCPGDYPVAVGIPASGGVATGAIALSGERAVQEAALGNPVILVRESASPDDLPGISVAEGILTARGARTSHAAVVARQLGKICVVQCGDLEIDPGRKRCILSGHELREGSMISIDGNTGNVYIGAVEWTEERPIELISLVHAWERGEQI